MPSYFGDSVRCIIDNFRGMSRNRLDLDAEDADILLDLAYDINDRIALLRKTGGFHITCHGRLSASQSKMGLAQSQQTLKIFAHFLSFAIGREVAPQLRQGITDGEILWRDYSSYKSDNYKGVISWVPQNHESSSLSAVWPVFYDQFGTSEEGKSFIGDVATWYTLGNTNAALAEGSLLLVLAGLELIFNYWIVECNQEVAPGTAKGWPVPQEVQITFLIKLLFHRLFQATSTI